MRGVGLVGERAREAQGVVNKVGVEGEREGGRGRERYREGEGENKQASERAREYQS